MTKATNFYPVFFRDAQGRYLQGVRRCQDIRREFHCLKAAVNSATTSVQWMAVGEATLPSPDGNWEFFQAWRGQTKARAKTALIRSTGILEFEEHRCVVIATDGRVDLKRFSKLLRADRDLRFAEALAMNPNDDVERRVYSWYENLAAVFFPDRTYLPLNGSTVIGRGMWRALRRHGFKERSGLFYAPGFYEDD